MATITIRGIDDETAAALKEKAKQEETSVNAVTVRLLRESLGVGKRRRGAIHRDLDHLAGTWGHEEATEFDRATAVFENVDEEMWRR